MWSKIKRLMKIRFHFHMFRHTHATMLVRSEADYKDIQERLGYSNIETTMNTYARTSESLRQDTVDKFENIIKAL